MRPLKKIKMLNLNQTVEQAQRAYTRQDLAFKLAHLFLAISDNLEDAEELGRCAYMDAQELREINGEPPLPPLNYFGL